MSKQIRTEATDLLFDAILSLKDKAECYTFFEDICTINELMSLSQRFEVAKMLREQKTYLEIAEKTGASTATISRVNRSLNYGNDGYDMVFERIGDRKRKRRIKEAKALQERICNGFCSFCSIRGFFEDKSLSFELNAAFIDRMVVVFNKKIFYCMGADKSAGFIKGNGKRTVSGTNLEEGILIVVGFLYKFDQHSA